MHARRSGDATAVSRVDDKTHEERSRRSTGGGERRCLVDLADRVYGSLFWRVVLGIHCVSRSLAGHAMIKMAMCMLTVTVLTCSSCT